MKKYFGQFPGGRHFGKEEIKNATDVIKSKSPYRFSGLNLKMFCKKLETEMAKFVNKNYCLVVNSGTAALHCALYAIGIKRGDEVIIPAYGWSADLMTNSKKLLERSVRFHNLGMNRTIGKDPRKTNDPIGPKSIMGCGLNYRMSELSASVAYAQLKKIITGCKINWFKVKDKLKKLKNFGFITFRKINNGCEPNYAFLGFLKSDNISHKKLRNILK